METLLGLERRKQKRLDFVVPQVVTLSLAYVTGAVLGSPMVIKGSAGVEGLGEPDLSSILQSLVVYDSTGQSSALDLFFFNQALTGTYVDTVAFAPTAADMLNCIGVVNVAGADYIAAGASKSIAAAKNEANLGRVIKSAASSVGGKNSISVISVIAVCRGTPTYTGPLQFRFQFSNGT